MPGSAEVHAYRNSDSTIPGAEFAIEDTGCGMVGSEQLFRERTQARAAATFHHHKRAAERALHSSQQAPGVPVGQAQYRYGAVERTFLRDGAQKRDEANVEIPIAGLPARGYPYDHICQLKHI